MARPRMNLTGHRYGKLTVLRLAGEPVPYQRARWLALCDCGEQCERTTQDLRRTGWEPRCDTCLRKSHKLITHGETGTRLHALWVTKVKQARQRQRGRKVKGHRPPGMDRKWMRSYEAFAEWIRDNIGDHPGTGWYLARIDKTKGHEPDNIEWRPTVKVLARRERERAAGANQTYSPPTRCTASAGITRTRAPAQPRI